MNTSCLNHRLTDEERAQFRRDGYLIIEDALDDEMLETAVMAVDRIDERLREEQGLDLEKRVNAHDCIGKDAALLDLIDYPTTFPKVWGLMGWNIYLFHTQMVVTLHPARLSRSRNVSAGIRIRIDRTEISTTRACLSIPCCP